LQIHDFSAFALPTHCTAKTQFPVFSAASGPIPLFELALVVSAKLPRGDGQPHYAGGIICRQTKHAQLQNCAHNRLRGSPGGHHGNLACARSETFQQPNVERTIGSAKQSVIC
jgi:hypothetical protein